MTTTRERQAARALNQRVAQSSVMAASNAAVIAEQVATVAGAIPDDLSDQLDGLRDRLRNVEEQLP